MECICKKQGVVQVRALKQEGLKVLHAEIEKLQEKCTLDKTEVCNISGARLCACLCVYECVCACECVCVSE